MSKESTEYCYSWNGEDFNSGLFKSAEEALAEAAEENDNGHPLVHVGKASRPSNSRFFPDASDLIEHMGNQAADCGGEYAADYPDVSADAIADLDKQLESLLSAWCDKHGVGPSFYQIDEVKEYPLPTKIK